MAGIMLRHNTARSQLVLVPVLTKPLVGASAGVCPGCQTYHGCKTVHLIVDGDGKVMVSVGVLEDLRAAGMPELTILGEVLDPPPLHIGNGKGTWIEDRQRQDHEARTIDLRRN